MKFNFPRKLSSDADTKIKTSGDFWKQIGDALNTPEKTPKQLITEELKKLIGEKPIWTVAEDKREKLENNFKLRRKIVPIKTENQNVDYILPEYYLTTADKKMLKQNYIYFEKILQMSWGIKDGKQQNEVDDWGQIYELLEAMWVPKGFMSAGSSGNDKIGQDTIFFIPIFNPNTNTFEMFAVNKNGYKVTVFNSDDYYICVGLPSPQKK